ncbi:DUF2225 domain-containing protein [Clostridium sp. 1001275B_160808_H3]|uniref:DUF2225 domain-containing protein n=1 Tax=Clostridium sp. 1001275B_160808_H3 TaxID=2787110 RepID=UPI00189B4228|nr:DUF2225 domain-containing protein [Clostridium sp. 1001275B_160808_H3]
MISSLKSVQTKDSIKKDDNSDKATKNLFLKEVNCPVCENSFKTPTVKVNASRVTSRDSDLFIRYSVENPYLYEVWLCPSCGYAALKTDFNKIRDFQIKLVKEKITPKWVNREYDIPFTEKISIERYKLALVNSLVIESKNSTKAMLCLKIAWMYRLLMDEVNEKNYINQALIAFNDTFINEKLPVYGLDRFSIMYLIGELHRRVGDDTSALRWFSEVITSIGAPQKVKEMARDGKDKIRRY